MGEQRQKGGRRNTSRKQRQSPGLVHSHNPSLAESSTHMWGSHLKPGSKKIKEMEAMHLKESNGVHRESWRMKEKGKTIKLYFKFKRKFSCFVPITHLFYGGMGGTGESSFFPPPRPRPHLLTPESEGRTDPELTKVGEQSLPPTICNSWESGPCTSLG